MMIISWRVGELRRELVWWWRKPRAFGHSRQMRKGYAGFSWALGGWW